MSQPAFPSPNNVRVGDFVTGGHPGMTLRDYFAAKAMQAHVSLSMYEKGELWPKEIAVHAYEIADEMLKEREK